jgi:hypothetical protein
MQYANYASVVNAINCYDDTVLREAQQLALAITQHNEDYCTDSLFDAINASVDDLFDANNTCWQHKELREAIDLYNDEQAFDALHLLCVAMLQRSCAYQYAFT